jgi:hypothetical protein
MLSLFTYKSLVIKPQTDFFTCFFKALQYSPRCRLS